MTQKRNPQRHDLLEKECYLREMESNRILAEHHCFGVEQGVYREQDLSRKIAADTARAISRGEDVNWTDPVILYGVDERPRVTLAELIYAARLTHRQRRAIRLMQTLRKQTLVARAMNIGRPAVSRLLYRSFLRVRAVYPEMQEHEPMGWMWRLWQDEMRYKRRLIYRRSVTPNKQTELKM